MLSFLNMIPPLLYPATIVSEGPQIRKRADGLRKRNAGQTNKPSPKRGSSWESRRALVQVAAGFWTFFDLALDLDLDLDVRAATGVMLVGLPVAAACGLGLKNFRHSGESWDCFRTMQAVTRSMSGISELQRRNASGLQACCSSAV